MKKETFILEMSALYDRTIHTIEKNGSSSEASNALFLEIIKRSFAAADSVVGDAFKLTFTAVTKDIINYLQSSPSRRFVGMGGGLAGTAMKDATAILAGMRTIRAYGCVGLAPGTYTLPFQFKTASGSLIENCYVFVDDVLCFVEMHGGKTKLFPVMFFNQTLFIAAISSQGILSVNEQSIASVKLSIVVPDAISYI